MKTLRGQLRRFAQRPQPEPNPGGDRIRTRSRSRKKPDPDSDSHSDSVACCGPSDRNGPTTSRFARCVKVAPRSMSPCGSVTCRRSARRSRIGCNGSSPRAIVFRFPAARRAERALTGSVPGVRCARRPILVMDAIAERLERSRQPGSSGRGAGGATGSGGATMGTGISRGGGRFHKPPVEKLVHPKRSHLSRETASQSAQASIAPL